MRLKVPGASPDRCWCGGLGWVAKGNILARKCMPARGAWLLVRRLFCVLVAQGQTDHCKTDSARRGALRHASPDMQTLACPDRAWRSTARWPKWRRPVASGRYHSRGHRLACFAAILRGLLRNLFARPFARPLFSLLLNPLRFALCRPLCLLLACTPLRPAQPPLVQ